MRTLLLSLLLIVFTIAAEADVSKQIQQTSKKLGTFDQKYSNLHHKMSNTAKAIKLSEQELLEQEKAITRLSQKLEVSQEKYEENRKELLELKDTQQKLQAKQDLIENELIQSIAQNISINTLVKEKYAVTTESIISEEIMNELNLQTQRKIENLEQEHYQNVNTIKEYESRTNALQSSISNIDKEKAELLTVTHNNKDSIEKMRRDKQKYKHSIDTLLAQKRALSNTLARLNIIQSEEIKKAQQHQTKRTHKSATAKVTKSGSSYQNIKTKKYRGQKTIAPLSDYKLVKEFGPYTDPIYKIKIYNESVSLQPNQSDAKVNTVLNGKIILAKKTQILENVVIIKHANGLHTIYAHLDQIAPNIKKGKKVKKGSIIGRVNHELIFEVTQDNFHIDPMALIR
ncbi:MAG: peptidoglycan DD-metalloendopeptidase family protein [Helicobacteraceae bacterium]|jgi:septal ring factor EnvC (AmiA/AmiB activator)|nr:peptidoglycan DD-metalloendopeptidase family protein [Helicobacteraceae bacterium]